MYRISLNGRAFNYQIAKRGGSNPSPIPKKIKQTKHMNSYKHYFAIEKKIKAQGFDIDREETILQFTEGKTSSLKAMSHIQYLEFLSWLNRIYLANTTAQCGLMRKKIISLFVRMGARTDEGRIDMDHINGWCVQYGYIKQPLNTYSFQELPKLVSQVEIYHKSFTENLRK
jgi:hypothetical protein